MQCAIFSLSIFFSPTGQRQYVKHARIKGNYILQDCSFAFRLSRLSLPTVTMHLALSGAG